MKSIPLQKFLADAGIASRRKAEELISDGKIKVNGKIITQLGTKVDPTKDKILYNGLPVTIHTEKLYIALHKPIKYVTTVRDQFNRPTVMDLVRQLNTPLHPVGRLDYHTSGLLLLTNDGDFTYKLTHPKHETKKTYIVTVKGMPAEKDIQGLKKGTIKIDGQNISPAKITIIKKAKAATIMEVTIHEGKYRHIRKMFQAINTPVTTLHRIQVGSIQIGNLKPGQWRALTKKEIESVIQS